MLKKEDLYKIGIGTWKIDYENFENDINALVYSYNNGEVVKQMKKFLEKIDREKILDIEYVDNLQIHGSFISKIPLVEVYKEIKRLVDMEKLDILELVMLI